jgi:hypothetical protein
VVIIVIAKKWRKICNRIPQYSGSVPRAAGIYMHPGGHSNDFANNIADDVIHSSFDSMSYDEDDELTLKSQDSYKIDASVPEYVEEMNDYLNEGEQVGSTIADVYDNLTRAPDISEGKSPKFVSEEGICASDPWASSGHAPV